MTFSEKLPTDNETSTTDQTHLNVEPSSYFDGEKLRTSEEQCTPIVSITPAPTEEYDPTNHTNPCSPFYVHPTRTRPSMDSSSKQSSKQSIRVELRNGGDLEAGLTPVPSNSITVQSTDKGAVKEWPGSRLPFGMGRKKKGGLTCPKTRKWNWLSRLPKRQRLAVKLLIAVFLLGAMVGIALGVSVAVHGTVYQSKNQSAPIQK